MSFKEFLSESETKTDIKLVALWDDGTVIFAIDGKRYNYLVDTIYKQKIKNLAKYAPGKALNFVKSLSS
jgi:hypothetical protein